MLAISTPISVLQDTFLFGTGTLARDGGGGSSPYNSIVRNTSPQGHPPAISTFMISAACSKTTAKWIYSSSWILLSSLPGLLVVDSAPVTIPGSGVTVTPDPLNGVLGNNGSSGKRSTQAGPSPSPSNSLTSASPSPSPSSTPLPQPPSVSSTPSTPPSSGTNPSNIPPPAAQGPASPSPNLTNGNGGGSESGSDDNCSSAGAVLVSCSFGPSTSPSGSSSPPLGGGWPPMPSSPMTSSNSVNSNDNNSNSNGNNGPQGGANSGTQTSVASIKAAIISIASVAAFGLVALTILVVRRRKQLKQQREEEQASFNAYGAYHSGKTRRLKKTDQHVGLSSFCSTDTRSSVPLKPLEQFWNP
ncbi:hypothetical protein EMPS_01799 [Entomortierella parvispora]|uniref:Uncharacterized protein n=1 Tax=Entomortierella parvispora TaxID=205924 RepID=A0A9P3H3K7_9FUNG|nr:hypothetical protein EMPS_01799 [Entomortierella parvispora]